MKAEHRKLIRKMYSKGYTIRQIANKMYVNNTTIRGREYNKGGFSRSNICKVVNNLPGQWKHRNVNNTQRSMAKRWGCSSVDELRKHLSTYNILHLMPGSAKVPSKTNVALVGGNNV